MSNDAHRERYGRQLDVHRTTPGSPYTVDGCVTLCKSCHGPQPRRPRGQRFKDEPGLPRNVGIPEDWHAVLRRIAAKRQQPVVYAIISLAAAEAERLEIPDPPPTPWESDND
jgi:hypothetical protein